MAFVLLMSVGPIPAMADEATATVNYEKLTVLTTLGITEPLLDESLAATPVTRAEFALCVGNLIGVGEKYINDKRYYTDVPADHWAVNTINTLTQMGVISGNDGKFNPGNVISEIEAITMLFNAIGYKSVAQANGGFPAGYRDLANRLDVSSGNVELKEITFADACEILYSVLFAPVAQITNISFNGNEAFHVDEGTTVLEHYFNVKKIKGVLTSTMGVSVDSAYSCKDDQVRIDNELFNNECANAIEYLGRKVNAYYREDTETNTIFMIFNAGNDECIEIDIKDFENYNPVSHIVSYYVGNKPKKVEINTGSTVVRNGEGYSSKVKEAFQNLRKGKIIINKSGEGLHDIVIVKNYEDAVVMSVNSTQKRIYDRIDGQNPIDLFNTKYLKIYDINNNEKIFDDISEGMVLNVCRSDNYCEIIISENVVSGKISEFTSEKDDIKAKINNTVYSIASDYYKNNPSTFTVGETVTAYIDAFGECVYISKGDETLYEVGYIVATAPRQKFGVYKIKILKQSGTMGIYECNSKIVIDGKPRRTEKEIEEGLSAKSGKISRQLVRYKLDKDNRIKQIETAVPYGQKSENPSALRTETATGTVRYYSGNYMLGPSIKLAADTLCYIVPSEAKTDAQDKDYAVVTPAELGNQADYYVTAYKTNDYTNTADIILIETDESAAGAWYHHLVLVDSVYEEYDKETGEVVKLADVWINGAKYTYHAAEGRTFDEMPARMDKPNKNKIQAGDVLRVFKNSKGEITEADVAWSYATKTPSNLGTDWASYELFINYGYITSIKNGVIKFEYKENGEGHTGITGDGNIIVFDSKARGSENAKPGSLMDLYDAMSDKNLIFVAQRYGTTNFIIVLK